MPRSKNRAYNQQLRNKTRNLNHATLTPQDQKMKTAEKHFVVQSMLGRPFRKFNVIVERDDGDWFSSEDDLREGLILGVMKRLELQYPNGCENWSILIRHLKRKLKSNRRLYFYCNVADIRDRISSQNIDKFEYFSFTKEGNPL